MSSNIKNIQEGVGAPAASRAQIIGNVLQTSIGLKTINWFAENTIGALITPWVALLVEQQKVTGLIDYRLLSEQ